MNKYENFIQHYGLQTQSVQHVNEQLCPYTNRINF